MQTQLLAVSLFLCGSIAWGQSSFGSVLGRVFDSSGAVVPAVRVKLISLGTNQEQATAADASGLFQFLNLLPASYRLEAEAAGFKRFVREPIQVEVQQTIRIDVGLQVGDVAETVAVHTATPLLAPATSSLGEVVEQRKVEDLPLNGRNPLALVALVPGVVPQGFSQDAPAVPNFYAWGNFQIGGALGNQSEAMLDGASIHGALMNGVRFVPSEDSIQEFKVQTNNLSAEFGHTSGGLINLTSKPGTNAFHGSLFEFLRNEALDANNFFNNSRNVRKPAFTQNQFGGTLGGPVVRNRTFFFAAYEGFRQRRGRSFLLTVPTAEQRAGDFSKTFDAAGNLVPIYDPTTTRPDPATPGRYLRTQFPNNVIPPSALDPAAKVLAQRAYGLPNTPGAAFTNINNFAANAPSPADADQFNARGDHAVSSKQRLMTRYSRWRADTPGLDPFRNGTQVVLDIFPDFRKTQQGVIEDVYMFSPTLVADFRYSFVRFDYKRIPLTQGQDLTALGFNPNLQNAIPAEYRHIPNLTVAGMTLVFPGSIIFQAEDTHHVVANLSKVWSRHSVKSGVDFRVYRLNYLQSNDTTASFAFDARFTALDPLRASGGAGFASFMLGYAASGVANTPAFLAQQRPYRAIYFQDDFRASSRLTLNLGLRYDQEPGWTERYDRQSFFLPDAAHPLAQQAGLPLRGKVGLVNSADRETRALADNFLGQVAPRFGFAYTLTPRTVLRGGYGIFWLPKEIVRRDVVAESTGTGNTIFINSLDGGLTPFARLSNPFPTGIVQPVGRDPNYQTVLAGTNLRTKLTKENAYSQQWNFNVQRELPGDALVDVAYAGLKGTRLPHGLVELNQIPDELLSRGTALLTQVNNPFFGLIGSGPLSTRTVAQGQLLRPYPQYNSVALRNPFIASSIYHSLQLKAQKRFRSGAGLLAGYTFSKLISDTETLTTWLEGTGAVAGIQNSNNLRAERSLITSDVPQRLVVSGTYDLPFGAGRPYLANARGVAGKLVSGWALNGIYTAQRGLPIFVNTATNVTNSFGGGSRPNSSGKSARLDGPAQQRLNRWFDTAQFSAPPAFTFGNVGRTLPDVRTHGIHNVDVSAIKNTNLREKLALQFRAEFFNLLNRVQFGYPGQLLGTAQFGVVTSQANEPRLIQMALKLVF